jgi:chromosome segregation ATPase
MELAASNEQIIQANLYLESQVKSLTNDLTTNKIKEKNLIETFNQRAISETKVKAIESELTKVQDEKTKFEIEYKVLKEKYDELQKNFTCLENTYKCVKDKHCNDIANIENKVEEMSKEMQRVQNENQMLRTNDEKKRQDIHSLEIQRDMFREKYQEQKNKNNLLQSKLTEIEDDFKNIMKDKENEYNLKLKEDELKRMRIDSKVKIVNELQNRIQNYRNERLKKKNEDN